MMKKILAPKLPDDDDYLLFVLAETTSSLPLYTHLGTSSRNRRKAVQTLAIQASRDDIAHWSGGDSHREKFDGTEQPAKR
jgi:hypothetical protein